MKDFLKKNWSTLNKYCVAIYEGGSRVDPAINNPHDFDYISFAKKHCRNFVQQSLANLGLQIKGQWSRFEKLNTKQKEKWLSKDHADFSQVRVIPYDSITWFSYLDILMIHIIGEDICPKTDVIYEHRAEFLAKLKEKMNDLLSGKMKNNKRWYHLLRGAYILLNNSYEVTSEQKQEINILHDLAEGWEQVRDKTIDILNNLK